MSNCYWCGNPCICRHLGEDMPQPERASANLSTIGGDWFAQEMAANRKEEIRRYDPKRWVIPDPSGNGLAIVYGRNAGKTAAIKPWVETPPPRPTGAALDEWQRIVSERLSSTFDVTAPADSEGYQLHYTGNWIPEIKSDASVPPGEIHIACNDCGLTFATPEKYNSHRDSYRGRENCKQVRLMSLLRQCTIADQADRDDDDCDCDEEDDE